MSAYLYVEILAIHNPAMYKLYIERVGPLVIRHGGTYLARGGTVTPFVGESVPQRVILIGFEDRAQLDACFLSSEYRAIAPLREQSTESRALIIEEGEARSAL